MISENQFVFTLRGTDETPAMFECEVIVVQLCVGEEFIAIFTVQAVVDFLSAG